MALSTTQGSTSRGRATLTLQTPTARGGSRSAGRALLSNSTRSLWTVYAGTAANGAGYWTPGEILGTVPWDGDTAQQTVPAAPTTVPFQRD